MVRQSTATRQARTSIVLLGATGAVVSHVVRTLATMRDVESDRKLAVLAFASSCKQAGVRHFELLGSVGANARSRSFYLRTKGALEEGLEALGFERLSLFRPSMILTPTNRYGLTRALTLTIWPRLSPQLGGRLRKYRGIRPVRHRTPGVAWPRGRLCL